MAPIAIFGASGNIGSHLVTLIMPQCEEQGQALKLISRDPDALRRQFPELPGCVAAVQADITVDDERLRAALTGCERVFMCMPQAIGSGDMDKVSTTFSDACKASGVQHIIRISSLGIDDYQNGNGPSQGPLGEAHVKGEEYIKSIGLTLTSIRPTSFTSNFVKYDLESIRSNSSFASPLGTEAAVNWVTCKDIAKVAAKALLDSSLDGKTLNVTGPASSTLTASKMQELLTRKTGKSIIYKEVPAPPIEDLQGLWSFLRAGGFNVSTDVVREITGEDPQSFEEFLEATL